MPLLSLVQQLLAVLEMERPENSCVNLVEMEPTCAVPDPVVLSVCVTTVKLLCVEDRETRQCERPNDSHCQ